MKRTTEHMIKIPESLFAELCHYHLYGKEELGEAIKLQLEAKLKAKVENSLYTKGMTAKTEEERKKAMEAYISMKKTQG